MHRKRPYANWRWMVSVIYSRSYGYDREHDQDDNIDIPLLRWRSTQLAQSMATHGSEDDPVVSRWLEIAEEDPLPEVRYVKSPGVVRQPENEERVDERPGSHTE